MSQLKSLLITVLFIFSVQHTLGQSMGKKSLSHLDGVRVVVSVDEKAQEEGLFKSFLKSNTELQLRKANINVYSEDEFAEHPAAPALVISVATYERRGLFSYTVSTKVSQIVSTVDGTKVSGTTYRVIEEMGVVGANNIRNLTDVVRRNVRTFINDWLSVHEQ